jgi:glutaredoxin
VPAGDGYYYLKETAVRAKFDPTAEICDNDVDDTGDGKTDCEDETCKKLPVCIDFDKPTITFFVMSYCPFGNQAEEGIEPVYQLLGDKAKFEPRYIYYENYGGGGPDFCMDDGNKYCSMHGVVEANQNIRENCVLEKYGIGAWFEFVFEMNAKCNSKNADTCWTAVAEGLGYDTGAISSCQKNDYVKFASEDLQMSTGWGARGSPSVFINGKAYSGSRTPEGYKQALCKEFDVKPSECDTELEGDANAPAPAGGCG